MSCSAFCFQAAALVLAARARCAGLLAAVAIRCPFLRVCVELVEAFLEVGEELAGGAERPLGGLDDATGRLQVLSQLVVHQFRLSADWARARPNALWRQEALGVVGTPPEASEALSADGDTPRKHFRACSAAATRYQRFLGFDEPIC